MAKDPIKLSQRQTMAWRYLEDGTTREVLYGGVAGGVNNYLGNVDGSAAPGSGATLTREMYADGVDVSAAQNARGSLAIDPSTMGQSHNNLQPYYTMVWMIKL